MEEVLVAKPVIAEIVPVVGGHHDHRVLHPARGFEVAEKPPELIVALPDQAHVRRDHLAADLVAPERHGDLLPHEGGIDRMRVLPLSVRSGGGGDVIGPVHGVIRSGDDVGPVGLDVAEMRAPRTLRPIQEPDRLRGQPRRLAVFLADVRGLVGVVEHPAAGPFSGVDSGIRIVRPRIASGVPPGLQVFVVGRSTLVVESVRSFTPQAVVPYPDVESAFGLPRTGDAVRAQSEACHPLGVHPHVGLADQPAVHPRRAQVIAQGLLADAQGKSVPLRSVGGCVPAGVEAHPARAANGRLSVGVGEADTHVRQAVEIRGCEMGMPGAAQIVETQLVVHDEQDVHRIPPSVAHGPVRDEAAAERHAPSPAPDNARPWMSRGTRPAGDRTSARTTAAFLRTCRIIRRASRFPPCRGWKSGFHRRRFDSRRKPDGVSFGRTQPCRTSPRSNRPRHFRQRADNGS